MIKDYKIGFCFLSMDGLPYIQKWNDYFRDVPKEKYVNILHVKKELIDSNLKQLFLHGDNNICCFNCVPSQWGFLLPLEIFLLRKAKELECDKVVFISDTTLPLTDFDTFYSFCTCEANINKTILSWDNTEYSIYDMRQPQNELKGFMTHGQQWVIIDKRHFDTILGYKDLDMYGKLFVADEHFFPTLFKGLGIIQTEALNRLTTWQLLALKIWRKPPDYDLTFKELTDEIKGEIDQARKQGCFFIRKISPEANKELLNYIA